MKTKWSVVILAAMMIVGGCDLGQKDTTPQTMSNVSVVSAGSPAAKFPAGSQYAFVTYASEQEQSEEVVRIDQRIQKALGAELKKKGYTPGSYSDIDFYAAYTFGVKQQIDILIAKSQEQGKEWIGIVAAAENYVNGALLVQVVDAKTMEPVWLGVFNADILLDAVDEQTKQERVQYAARQLLQSFGQK